MQAYIYLIKVKWLVALAYRFEVITNVITQIILLVASVFFWKAAYGSADVIAGTTMQQMVDYTIVSMLLSLIYTTGVENEIRMRIRKGNVALDFLKPVSVMGMFFAQDIASMLMSLIIRFIPIFLVASLLFGPPLPVSFFALLTFIASAVLGFVIMWLISAVVGLACFWVIDLGPLDVIKNHIVNFLAGSFLPLWFLPSGFYEAMKYLPFIYIYQTPISLYIGKTPVTEAPFALAVQLAWVGILLVCVLALQKRAFSNVIVQGG